LSLNRRRRIFRPAALSLPSLPSFGLLLAVLAGALAVGGGLWLTMRPGEAPAQQPEIARIAADPSQIAVVDGGTMRLHDSIVRLDGIAPAARGETCRQPDGSSIDCGVAAANMLASLVQDAPVVTCQVRRHDPMGRALAVCDARGSDLNRALVASGWARADHGEPALQALEAQARARKLGLWAS
jgi:endonuclease YncB( thermonuclease family)